MVLLVLIVNQRGRDALKPVLVSRILVCQHVPHKGYLMKRSGLNIFLWSMCCVLVQDTFYHSQGASLHPGV